MRNQSIRHAMILVSVAFFATLIASLLHQKWIAGSFTDRYSVGLVSTTRDNAVAIIRERFHRLRNHAVAAARITEVRRFAIGFGSQSAAAPSDKPTDSGLVDSNAPLDDGFQLALHGYRRSQGVESDWLTGWCLMKLDGRVLASSDGHMLDQRWPIDSKALERIRSLESIVIPAVKSLVDKTELENTMSTDVVGLSLAPVVENGVAIAVIGWVVDLDIAIQPVLDQIRYCDSGEVYLFSSSGLLMTRARPKEDDGVDGVVATGVRRLSLLNKPSLKTRSGNLISDSRGSAGIVSVSPLTFAVDQAIRGGTGTNLTGYEGCHGSEVVGAFTWLDDLELGLVSEVDRSEVLPLKSGSLLYWITVVSIAGFTLARLNRLLTMLSGGLEGDPKAPRARRRLGQYELHEVIGRGGMGDVYRGTHHLLNRPIAVKVLEGRDLASQAINRFEREVQVTASLRHPNTIAVYDYGKADDQTFYYVMEHVDGISLQQLVDDFGAQPAARVIHLLLQICGSLSEAHRRNFVHRDIKPANVLISGEPGMWDFVKVVDFGLIKSLELEESTETLTRSDTVTGTPMYMPPECVRDAGMANAQSDIYSVGAVGYVLLAGVPLFDGDNSVDICSKQLHQDPRRPSHRIGRKLSEDLQNVLMSCLRKDPSERPRSVDDLAATLRSCVDAILWNEGDAMDWWQNEFANTNLSRSEICKDKTENGTLMSHSAE